MKEKERHRKANHHLVPKWQTQPQYAVLAGDNIVSFAPRALCGVRKGLICKVLRIAIVAYCFRTDFAIPLIEGAA